MMMILMLQVELQMAFIEANLLSVMTDWLAPMPDKSLPHIMIRNEFLKLLDHLKIDDSSRLKESGIGQGACLQSINVKISFFLSRQGCDVLVSSSKRD